MGTLGYTPPKEFPRHLIASKTRNFFVPTDSNKVVTPVDLPGASQESVMSNFLSRLFAIILTLTFAGVTVCSAGERASTAVPDPAVDAPLTPAKSEQTVVVAGGG